MSGFSLDHVGIAVESIESARPMYESLGAVPASSTLELPEHGVNVAFVGEIELLEPHGSDSPLHRFLTDRGSGLHHIAYRVLDVAAALERARELGLQPIDSEPRAGAHGHRIAFLHPRSTGGILIELVESVDPDA